MQKAPEGRAPEYLRLPFQMVCHEIAESYPGGVQVFHDTAHPGIMHFIALDGIQHEFADKLAAQASSYLIVEVQVGLGLPVSGLERWKEGYIHSPGLESGRTPERTGSGTRNRPKSAAAGGNKPRASSLPDPGRIGILPQHHPEGTGRGIPAIAFPLGTEPFQITLIMESAAVDKTYGIHRGGSMDFTRMGFMAGDPGAGGTPADAVGTGFCGPPPGIGDKDATLIESAKRYIEENYMQELSLTSLAEQYNYHPTYFSEMFKEGAGVSFIQYVTEVRMKHAVRLLQETRLTVWDIAELTGFSSPGYFSSKFKKCSIRALPSSDCRNPKNRTR